jgi:acetyl-CoA synthetase
LAIVTVADAQGTPLKAGDFNFWNEVKQQSDQCDLVSSLLRLPVSVTTSLLCAS